jgi:hypothetical protein
MEGLVSLAPWMDKERPDPYAGYAFPNSTIIFN